MFKTIDQIEQREGYKRYLANWEKVSDYIRKGWELSDDLPYNVGYGRPYGLLLEIKQREYEKLKVLKQIESDLISYRRGVDDGKDLHRYAHNYYLREIKNLTVWMLIKLIWKRFMRLL